MANEHQYLNLRDLRGGMNNSDEPQSLPDNQVAYAQNIDWSQGTIGSKRAGCESVSIDNSVMNNVLPEIVSTSTNGGTGVGSVNVTVPAISDDGTGTAYLYMAVFISTKNAAQDVTAVTYQGNPITASSESAGVGASGRLELWTLNNPNMAGGTVAVTLAAACDVSVAVEVWRRASGATGLLTTTGTSALPRTDFPGLGLPGHTDARHQCIVGVSFNTGVTATVGAFHTSHANLSNGQSRLFATSRSGGKPEALLYASLSGSVDWVMTTVSVLGAPASAFPVAVRPLAIMRHTPTNNLTEDELWVVDTYGRIDRRVGGTWQTGVPVINHNLGIFNHSGLDINGASLHGKFFIASQQVSNATMIWDGTVLRWAGFPTTPSAVTVANTAGAGTYSGTRYFRMRFAQLDGSNNVLRRSEPSATTSFVPSGANSGAVITKPTIFGFSSEDFIATAMNGQTHWEVEASLDNANFYRIATVAIATGTYTDTTAFATGYTANPLSDAIGDNTAPYCARHLAVDDDRLVFGGHRLTNAMDSRVSWTPVASANGVGNDERIPTGTGNFLDLDGLSGGGLQMLISGESGNIYAFKWERLYKLVRTGILTAAYAPQTESQTRGSTKRGAVSGQDQGGNPCVYFTDPTVGLCRVGRFGVQILGQDVDYSWKTTTLSHPTTAFGPRLLYWADKQQVWIQCANSTNTVGKILVYNVRFGVESAQGWSLYTSDLLNNLLEPGGVMFPDGTTVLKPFFANLTSPNILKFTTTAVNDSGTRYRAYWTTKAYMLGNLFQKFGITAANMFARAGSATIGLALIRNLGIARRTTTTNLAAAGTETHVFKPIDNAFMSECCAVQFEVGDPSTYSGAQLDQTWILNQIAFKWRMEDESTS